MPPRNLLTIVAVSMLSLACYRASHAPHRHTLDVLGIALETIQQRYVESVEERTLMDGALEGMVGRLDPYSSYVNADDYQVVQESLDQQFGGVGIEVAWDERTQMLTVQSPIVGSPAFEAGVLAGDRIVAVDGEAVIGIDREELVQRLRGRPGTPVRLGVLRGDQDESLSFELRRAVIHVDTVLGDVRGDDGRWSFALEGADGIGYVRLTSFARDSVDEFRAALDQLVDQGCQGVIVDLRGNAGGLFEGAIDVCNLFLGKGRIVSTRGRDARTLATYDASPETPYPDLPLVLLVDRFSASASEIVAACLQDQRRATIVGERTWGKGTVQDLIDLEPLRTKLRITTAKYYRPSEQNIHRDEDDTEQDEWGVTPAADCLLRLDDEQFERLHLLRRLRDRPRGGYFAADELTDEAFAPPAEWDPHIARAIQVLQGASSPVAKASAAATAADTAPTSPAPPASAANASPAAAD